MKENNNDSDDIIINISSSVEKTKIIPPKLIPELIDDPNQKASIETISRKSTISEPQPKIPGRIGQKGTILLSKDCHLGADAAPADLLKDIININPETILSPLLTIRKSCFKRMSVENILK